MTAPLPPAPSPSPTLADSPVQATLQRLHDRFAPLQEGRVASYIPELARADPRHFAIVLATVDGQVYEVGDSREPFTLQSISKPLVYGIALEDRGAEVVARTVGVEPSGDAFNSISLEPGTGRPLNPMINAGAIATASLVGGADAAARLARVVDAISAYAGRALDVDEAVFESERATGHRNRAIGHLLRNHDILSGDPEDALALYFRQCSLRVDCRDLALMAATLANGGLHPLTGRRAVDAAHVGAILSVMTTCGMYDFAGEWVTRVGMPAKSGVGGGIIAVLPGQLGIGVFSPALDERGNSVRGVRVCEALSGELGLHFLQPPRGAGYAVRARYSAAQVRSKRRWAAPESAVLDRFGHAILVHELQGDLCFTTLEPVVRALCRKDEAPEFAVLDFQRVSRVDAAALRLLARLVEQGARHGRQLVLSRVRRDLLDGLGGEVHPRDVRALRFQPQLDGALEWCERQLVARHVADRQPQWRVTLAEHGLCTGLSPEEVDWLDARLLRQSADAGTVLVHVGDQADEMYLLLQGEVSVVVPLPAGGSARLATLGPGMSFGEAALLEGGARSAEVRADTQVECGILTREAFEAIERERPALAIRLLRQWLRTAAQTVVRLTSEVSALHD